MCINEGVIDTWREIILLLIALWARVKGQSHQKNSDFGA